MGSRMKKFATDVASKKVQAENITVECYCWLVDGWSPFWADVSSGSTVTEGKMLIRRKSLSCPGLLNSRKELIRTMWKGSRRRRECHYWRDIGSIYIWRSTFLPFMDI